MPKKYEGKIMSKRIELSHNERIIRDAWIEDDPTQKEKIIVMRQITVGYQQIKSIRLTQREFTKFVDFILKELKNA